MPLWLSVLRVYGFDWKVTSELQSLSTLGDIWARACLRLKGITLISGISPVVSTCFLFSLRATHDGDDTDEDEHEENDGLLLFYLIAMMMVIIKNLIVKKNSIMILIAMSCHYPSAFEVWGGFSKWAYISLYCRML